MIREKARKSLATLGEIVDRRSILALVGALKDRDPDVAWLAAEGLSLQGMAAWPPVLRALVRPGLDSARFRRGAHRVFAKQKQDGFDDLLHALMKDLEANAVKESTTVDAYAILDRIARRHRSQVGAGPASARSAL